MSPAQGLVTVLLADGLPGSCCGAAIWWRPGADRPEIILLSANISDCAGAVLETAIVRMLRLRRLAANTNQYEQFECVDDTSDPTLDLEEPFLSATLRTRGEYSRLVDQIRSAPKEEIVGIGSVRIGSISF